MAEKQTTQPISQMNQDEQLKIVREDKEKDTVKMWRIIGSIVSVVLLITLILIKVNRPSFPLFWFIGGIIFIIILFFAFFFGFSIYRKYQEAVQSSKAEVTLPKAITLEQARLFIKEILVQPQYADYEVGWFQSKVYVVGEELKSRILLVHLEPTPYSVAPFQFFVMNLHYPRELYSYFTQNKYNPSEITRVINNLAVDPRAEPDVERRVETDLSTGRTVEYTKRSQKFKKIEDKKGDLE